MCGVSNQMRSSHRVSLTTFGVNIKCYTSVCWRTSESGERGLPSEHTMRDFYRGMVKYDSFLF